uniref:Jacalin-type lectin domain-containing protein n=1 Tax=Oryzias latipes TaxID=8090 RepID=A0A3P9KKR2_ORYLA
MSYLAPVKVVGGEGGTPFSYNVADTGAQLKNLVVMVGPDHVTGIGVEMIDGDPQIFGAANGDSIMIFNFEDGEYFSSLTLWPNSTGDRLGGIKFTTTKERIFEVGAISGQPETEVDVGSGMCFGVKGRSTDNIDFYAFGFLKEVQPTLRLNLNSELVNREINNSEFSVSEKLIRVRSINSEWTDSEVSVRTATTRSHYQWSADITSHHGNREKKRSAYVSPAELDVLLQSYSEYDHIFQKKSNTAASAKQRQLAWET